MEIKAYAKINLCLDVLRKREDGYHEVEMVMTNVDIFDVLHVNKAVNNDILLVSNDDRLATDESNLIYKAVLLLQKETGRKFGIDIGLEKNIPVEAGMGGGSADAAAALVAVNEVLELGIGAGRLLELGAKLGADVPFCMTGGTVLAGGIGEKLKALNGLPELKLLIVKPKAGLSTKRVYESLGIDSLNNSGFIHPNVRSMADIIESDVGEEKKVRNIARNLANVLEVSAVRLLPMIDDIKQTMNDFNCLGSLMSGSGTSVFGIFDNDRDMELAKEKLEKNSEIDYVKVTGTGGIDKGGFL